MPVNPRPPPAAAAGAERLSPGPGSPLSTLLERQGLVADPTGSRTRSCRRDVGRWAEAAGSVHESQTRDFRAAGVEDEVVAL
jgi:hypothetical protein